MGLTRWVLTQLEVASYEIRKEKTHRKGHVKEAETEVSQPQPRILPGAFRRSMALLIPSFLVSKPVST